MGPQFKASFGSRKDRKWRGPNATNQRRRRRFGHPLSIIPVTSKRLCVHRSGVCGECKVTIDQARSIALNAHPGTITDEELEKEKGGSGLRYSFDIKSGKITYEVGVDAQTGKVLEDSKEGRHPD